jgi:hypothetical protein
MTIASMRLETKMMMRYCADYCADYCASNQKNLVAQSACGQAICMPENE